MSRTPDLTRLAPYRDAAIEAHIRDNGPKPGPDEIHAGSIDGVSFIVTRDADGQIEASVGVPRGRATAEHVRGLCRLLGVDPPVGAQRISEGAVFWVVRAGSPN